MTLSRLSPLALVIACLLPLPASAAPPERVQFSGQTRTTSPEREAPVPGQIFMGEDAMRLETTIEGNDVAVVMGPGVDGVLMIVPGQQIAMQLPDPPEGSLDLEPLDPNNPCAEVEGATCRRLRSEQREGRPVQVWEVSEDERTTTVWIDETLRFPVRVEDREGHAFEITDVQVGPQPRERFLVPDGYQQLPAPTPGPEAPPEVQ